MAERLALGRDPGIVRNFGGDPDGMAPLGQAEVAVWYSRLSAEPSAWVIELDGRFIGTVRLHSFVAADRRASFAIGILDPGLLGQGLGTEATRLVLAHAFGGLKLHRVALRVLADNARAIRSYEKSGFVREGIERESARVGDRWVDDVMMGVVVDRWQAQQAL